MALLTCEALTLGYNGIRLVEDLSFQAEKGAYLCIVGENGSGKSTLMKTLLRLQTPLAGRILTGDGLASTDIGYLPQQTEVQRDFPASVREIVLSGCQNRCGLRPFYTRAEKQLAAEMLEKLGIAALTNRCYRELSGGQQQRVLLARALCAARRLLLLDEPAAGLDPKAAAELYELIARLNREDQVTILMVTHDIAAAIRYASHILHIGQGAPFFGTTAEYLESGLGSTFLQAEQAGAPVSTTPATGVPVSTSPVTGAPASTSPATGAPVSTSPATKGGGQIDGIA